MSAGGSGGEPPIHRRSRDHDDSGAPPELTGFGGLFGEPRGARGPRPRAKAHDTAFSHSSERLFARLLDFYGILWEYEPRTFDLTNGEGVERFTPDFYLPDHDLYVEITTMSQKLVTRKNRKVRLLREQYPDVRCKIFYQRDIYRLATKHGIEVPKEDLTAGESSQ